MPIQFTAAAQVPDDAQLLAVPVFKGRTTPEGAPAEIDVAFLEARGFEGNVGDVHPLLADDGTTILAIGMGEQDKLDLDCLRRAAACVSRSAGNTTRIAVALLSAAESVDGIDRGKAAQAIAEGVALGAYKFIPYKTDGRVSKIESVTVVGRGPATVQKGLDRGSAIADAVALARDLVNTPPKDMTPRRMEQVARGIAEREGLELNVLDEKAIAKEGLGGIMGVSAGSAEPPRLIQLTYDPGNARSTVALVGKGITFDSGGLSIKTSDGMMTMKTDMSGAAAVLGAMAALPTLAPRVKVIGYAACAENLPSGTATKPGDVLRIRNGKSVEVLNTDAEGRLVLADALSLAVEAGVDAIVDLATLTGACVVALGREIGGLMGSDDGLVEQVREASERAGEPMWPLPLPDRYRKHIDSDVADIKNMGAPGQAGTLAAGLFLKEFVDDVPWAHLDIAGPARSEGDSGYICKGGTGVGVRTVLELLTNFRKPARR